MVAKASSTDYEEHFSLDIAEGNSSGEDDNMTTRMDNSESSPNPNRPSSPGGFLKYISYEALSANSIPCSLRGQSYYDCRSKMIVNPYRRGCSAITRCRRLTD
ncbi:protein RALF-like 4 [Prosopis cineraria]|uniref:protein RALF-like 4 n=1 Tax=Prosopis cineraria TaxID=364024 RepID=UPI00240FCC08|nr:protein RALF-like 4 [Prosopis cineraria]